MRSQLHYRLNNKGWTLPTVIWRASREGVCLGDVGLLWWGRKHTHWISRARARWCSDEYSMYHTGMQQPNEETYPGPLLVNIDRPYPHREWPTISPPYEWSDRYLLSSPPNSWYPTRLKTAPQLCDNTGIHTRSKAYRNRHTYSIADSPQIQNKLVKLSNSLRNVGESRTHKMLR